MDPGAALSPPRETFEARRATLLARAATEREALARQLAPLAVLDRGLEMVWRLKTQLPLVTTGLGLGLSALLLALPTGRLPIVRGGVALLNLAGSVKGLFTRR